MWAAVLALLVALLPVALLVVLTLIAYVQVQLGSQGYAQLTLGPLWVMILPGYVAVSW
jgi:uncharacterized membrane protein